MPQSVKNSVFIILFVLSFVLAAEAVSAVEFKFDFQPSGSPVQDGFIEINKDDLYAVSPGYGWDTGLGSPANDFDRAIGGDLERDFIYDSADRQFNVDLPNGKYDVTVYLGDKGAFAHDDVFIDAEAGSWDLSDVDTTAGEVKVLTFGITVSDGQLNILFRDNGGADPNWVSEGLIIKPSTITVCSSGCDFITIQDAVNAAAPGGTIEVGEGTYDEQVVINKPLTLKGPNAGINPNIGTRVAEAIIQTDDLTNHQAVLIEASNVDVNGFTLYGPNGGIKDIGAIGLTSSGPRANVRIEYNRIFRTTGGTDWNGDGIRLDPPSNEDASIYIEHNLINVGDTVQSAGNNDITLADHGYWLSHKDTWVVGSPDRVVIRDNYFYGHSKIYVEGIGVLIDTNKFLGIWGPIEVRGSKDVVISNNNIVDQTDVAIYVWSPKDTASGAGISSDVTITKNVIKGMKLDPQSFTDEGTGIILGGVTNVIVNKNTISGNAGSGIVISGVGYDHFYPEDIGWGGGLDVRSDPVNNVIYDNSIFDNELFGVRVDASVTSGIPIDARFNWWGSDTGPTHVSNPGGTGDGVSDNVDFSFWLMQPFNPSDNTKPKVQQLILSHPSPVPAGTLLFTIIFDEDMDVSMAPNVKLQKLVTTHTISPNTTASFLNGWSNVRTWNGVLVVDSSTGDGEYTIRISDAKDVVGNKMSTDTSNKILIDSVSPQILQTFVPDIFGNQNLTLAISAFDPGSSGVVRITASIDGGVEQNMTFAFREQQKIGKEKAYVDKYFLTTNGSSLSSATHNVVFKVYDNTGNQNVSSAIQFKRDSTVKFSGGSIAFLCKNDPVSEVVRKFDFGTKNSPLQTGYTRVTHDTLYPTGSGYGWSSAAFGSLDRGVGDKLTRDFVFDFDTATKEFRVSLPSDTYNVTVLMGDTLFAHDNMSVTIEGHPNSNIDTSVGQIKTITNVVNVTDGQLNIVFGDAGGADPNWVVNAIEISTKPICIDGIEKQTINWLKSKGWTVDFDKYSDWTLASLITHKLIICSDQENACKPTSAVSSAHKINKIPFVEIPDSTSAKAAAGFSYLTAPGGTRSQPTANEFFENPESISTGFFGSAQVLTSPQKLTKITGKMATYVKDIAAPDDSPKYTNMFKADESGTRGRFVFVGWFFGRTTSSGFVGWSPTDLSSNGQLILQRAVNWAQCGNPTGCI